MAEFYAEDVALPELDGERLDAWFDGVAQGFGKRIASLSYVFCSDAHLHGMNVEYLNHDTLTDIITFDLDGTDERVEGECYVSVERVEENAASFGVSREAELRRVMVHGLLHLCGLGDKSAREQGVMRAAEQRALEAYG